MIKIVIKINLQIISIKRKRKEKTVAAVIPMI